MSKFGNIQWTLFSSLLDIALDLPEAERPAWLEGLRQKDPETAALVARALEAKKSPQFGAFLEGQPLAALHESTRATLVGSQIGAYEVDAEIGRGGMGSVWRAHRTDGRYEQTVAIKFVHASWLGDGGEQRFQQEGRLLSRFNHPHIARLLDAGVLDRTQPYLVLEYVEGISLDEYCEQQQLSLRARVTLFLDVLGAVAHAHANLIVHRDLKPANVLVTPTGAVKLLDFGIAKLVDDAQPTQQTQLGAVALTPLYAAPEQLRGEPVTTATDVYSLGLMLYLLLTGTHANALESESRSEIIQATLTAEPALASKAARLQSIEARALRGDIDNILHKAIKKSPDERYSSATAFADDLRRFLVNEPVQARPDTVGYRVTKFVMRHRLGTALAGIAIAALSASVVVSAMQTRRASSAAAVATAERSRADEAAKQARRQRDLALAGIAQSQDLTELTSYLLGEALPDDRAQLREQVLMRGVEMVRAAKGFPPERRAQMLEVIATHFENNRDFDHAEQLYNEAHNFALTGADPGIRASTSCHLALMHTMREPGEKALAEVDQAIATLPPDAAFADPQVICRLDKSQLLIMQGRPPIEVLESATTYLKQLQVPNPWLESDVVSLLTAAYVNAMQVPDAERAFAREKQLLDEAGTASLRIGMVHFANVGTFYWKIGRPLDARANLEKSQQVDRQRGIGEVDSDTAVLLKARIENQLGDSQEAVADYARAAKMGIAAGDARVEGFALGEAIGALINGGDFEHAGRALPLAEKRLHGIFENGYWMFGVLRLQAALIAEHHGETNLAQRLADEAIAILDKEETRNNYPFAIALVQKSGIERRIGHLDAARADAERAMSYYETHFGKIYSVNFGDALVAEANIASASGDSALAKDRTALAKLHYESSVGAERAGARLTRLLAK